MQCQGGNTHCDSFCLLVCLRAWFFVCQFVFAFVLLLFFWEDKWNVAKLNDMPVVWDCIMHTLYCIFFSFSFSFAFSFFLSFFLFYWFLLSGKLIICSIFNSFLQKYCICAKKLGFAT